jgi:hypothetical protein
MRQEVFYLAYHLHWPYSDIMGMELRERWSYVQMLSERIEAENQAVEAMSARWGRG